MKKIFTLVCTLACLATSVFANDADTTAKNFGVALNKETRQLDFDIPFYTKFSKPGSRAISPDGLGFGMIATTAKTPYDFNAQNSFEVFYYLLDDCKKGASTFSYGLGVNWKNFTMTGETCMFKEGSQILTGPYPTGTSPKLSRLRVFSLSFPVLYSCSFGSGFGFTLGPVLNLNTSSVINTKYRIDGAKKKDKYKNAHCNIATVDLMFQLHLKYFSFYAKYCPMNIMDKAYWPEFQQFSFGIAL